MPRWVEVTGSLCLLSTNFGRWRSFAVVEFCKANPRREGAADEAILGAEAELRVSLLPEGGVLLGNDDAR
jgi:hypothetical protein